MTLKRILFFTRHAGHVFQITPLTGGSISKRTFPQSGQRISRIISMRDLLSNYLGLLVANRRNGNRLFADAPRLSTKRVTHILSASLTNFIRHAHCPPFRTTLLQTACRYFTSKPMP
jgi:hypothetical protein